MFSSKKGSVLEKKGSVLEQEMKCLRARKAAFYSRARKAAFRWKKGSVFDARKQPFLAVEPGRRERRSSPVSFTTVTTKEMDQPLSDLPACYLFGCAGADDSAAARVCVCVCVL